MIIRPLAENEISAVAELEKLCFSTPWSEKSIRDSFFSDNNRFFVCEADGQLRPSNTTAVSLYEGFGFEKVGERRNYYRNPAENALLLTKFFR